MPEVHGDQLDVSAEEQRYLRRTFRRFALPWLILAAALGALAGSLPRWIEARPEPAGAAEDPHASEPSGAPRGELAALSQRVVGAEAALANMRERVALLESRGGSGGTEVQGGEALEQRFDAFGSRIATLESRLGPDRGSAPVDALRLEQQLDALAERLARLEAGPPDSRADAPADLDR